MSMKIEEALTELKETHRNYIIADVYDIVDSVEIPQFASRVAREKKEAIKERDNLLVEARAKVKKLAEGYETELSKEPTLTHLRELLEEQEKSYNAIMDPIIKQQNKEKKMRDEGVKVVNPTALSYKDQKVLAEINSEIERLTNAIHLKSKNEIVYALEMAKILKDIPELKDEIPSTNRAVVESTRKRLEDLKTRAAQERKAWEKKRKEEGIEGRELKELREDYNDSAHTTMGKSFLDLRDKIRSLEIRFQTSGAIGYAILREFDHATRDSLKEFRYHVNKLIPEKGTYGKLYEIRKELISQIDEAEAKLDKKLKKELKSGKDKSSGTLASFTAVVDPAKKTKTRTRDGELKASKASKFMDDENAERNFKFKVAQEKLEARSRGYATGKNKMQMEFNKADLGGSTSEKGMRWVVHKAATRTKIRTQQYKFINAVYQIADQAKWESPEDKFKFIYTALTVVRDKEPVETHWAKSRLLAGIDKELKLIKGAFPDLQPTTEDEFKDRVKKAYDNIGDTHQRQNLEKQFSDGYTAINQQAYIARLKRKK